MRTNFEFNSFNEIQVKGYLWHQPSVTPKGIVIISHGMAESVLRYERVANFLVEHEIFVYGVSHRGHGETAGSVERLGYIGKDGWNRMVEDFKTVVEKSKSDYPGIPKIVFGHSMGSFVARDYMLNNSHAIDGLVLSGTGYPKKFELQAAYLIGKFELLLKPSDKPSKKLDKLSFGKFNAQIENTKTPFDWLSRDEVEVKAYIDNPLCGQIHPTSFFIEFTKNLNKILYQTTPKFTAPFIPILLMSGEQDPVGEFGKGVTKSAEYYKIQGFPVKLHLYPEARHELLNELNREAVHEDLLEWIEQVIQK